MINDSIDWEGSKKKNKYVFNIDIYKNIASVDNPVTDNKKDYNSLIMLEEFLAGGNTNKNTDIYTNFIKPNKSNCI